MMGKTDFTREEKLKISNIRLTLLFKFYASFILGLIMLFFNFSYGDYSIFITSSYISWVILILMIFNLNNSEIFLNYTIFFTLGIIYFMGNMLLTGISIFTKYVLYWGIFENGTIIAAALLTIFVSYIYENHRFNKNLQRVIRKKKIDLVNGLIGFEMWNYPVTNKLSEKIIQIGSIGLLPVVFIFLGILSIYIQANSGLDNYESRKVALAFLGVAGGIYGFVIVGLLAPRYVYVYQWQKKNKRTIHTPLFEYLQLQEEINQNRKSQGLKSLNIKKPYLTDKFYGFKKKK